MPCQIFANLLAQLRQAELNGRFNKFDQKISTACLQFKQLPSDLPLVTPATMPALEPNRPVMFLAIIGYAALTFALPWLLLALQSAHEKD